MKKVTKQKLIKDSINEINQETDPITIWEIIKGTIRNQTIQ